MSVILSFVCCTALISPSSSIKILTPFLMFRIQISKMRHHCRIKSWYIPLVCLHCTPARLAGIPWSPPISIPRVSNFPSIREPEFSASAIELLARQRFLWSNDMSHSKILAEPSERLDSSTFTCSSGFSRVLASAFVVDDKRSRPKNASSIVIVGRNPVSLKKQKA